MKFDNLLSDEAVMAELGRRLSAARLAQRLTQAQLAQSAGVSKSTVERLEDGGSTQLGNLVRCLRALNRLDGLELLLPLTPANPVDLLERGGASRVRVRTAKAHAPVEPWAWGDEP